MKQIRPTNTTELCQAMREAAATGQRIRLGGAFTKDAMGGAVRDATVSISTSGMRRVLAYEPKDLTVSVEAGLPWIELTHSLAGQGQMLPLDPPLAAVSTVGGVVAANLCGSRRRLFGSVRDMVIGMSYCTLAGETAESGALVVKSVAGYDIHKLLTGSFGTLAAIASVNFKVAPAPENSRTFVFTHHTAQSACETRSSLARSVLQPAAVDYLNPKAASICGLEGHVILVRAHGSGRVLARYERELPGAAQLEGGSEEELWEKVDNLAPEWISRHNGMAVVKVVHQAQALGELANLVDGPVWSHALNGVTRLGCAGQAEVAKVCSSGPVSLVEWSHPDRRKDLALWPDPGPDFELMQRMKTVFDPQGLLNPGRLHDRI